MSVKFYAIPPTIQVSESYAAEFYVFAKCKKTQTISRVNTKTIGYSFSML